MIFKIEERGGQLVLFLSLALHANFSYKREIFSCKRGSDIIFYKEEKERQRKRNRKKESLRVEKREKKRKRKELKVVKCKDFCDL